MLRFLSLAGLVVSASAVSVPAVHAASFDCAKASTPFEHAICDTPDLSTADERLAKTYATAAGGLSEAASKELRDGQRDWLDYAQRACTKDAKPLETGSYDEQGISCLGDLFLSRSRALEDSRMMDGIRFYPVARFSAAPDPNEADNPESYFPVSRNETTLIQIDGDDALAKGFNTAVSAEADKLTNTASEGELDASSDTDNSIVVKEIAGSARITLTENTYWYGHGAAHGNYSTNLLHYLTKEGRWMEAKDLFTGKGWQKKLLELTVAALKDQHGDMLMLDDPQSIADAVADPTRWDLSDPYALVIQFQPYEVAAYAYGAPTAKVTWEALTDYLSESADAVRYGY